jgi:Sulfotransferase domain
MIASDFRQPQRRDFPAVARVGAYIPLLALGVPLAKALELAGIWPRVAFRAGRKARSHSFGAYRPTCHDVFACVGFKSGTTWLLQIAVQIACLGEAEFDNIHSVVPWPDGAPNFRKLIIPLTDDSPRRRSPTGLRIIKTHEQQQSVPYSSESRYIAMVRDPKDVIVSGYHFIRSLVLGPLMPSVRNWVDLNLSGGLPQGSWAEHLASYWRVRDKPNVLFLTYEQLSADPTAVIRQIAAFMKVDLSPQQLDAIVRASSFSEMCRLRKRFEPGRIVPWGKTDSMLRKGKAGSSGELLSAQLRNRIDDHNRAELRRLGCDFPYDSAFCAAQRP